MALYASTFISGLQVPIRDALKRQFPDISIISLYDGLVVYNTETNIEKIKKIRFFNNSFLILKMFKNKNTLSIETMIQSAIRAKDIETKISSILANKSYSYRIITSKENKLVSVNNNILKNMEMKLSKIKGLYLNRSKADLEFWFLLRREKVGFFMLRLTKKASTEKILNKGELRPELCYILCSIAGVCKDDILLDPFCGYGSIPIARAFMFPYNMIFASDNDWEKVKKLKQRVKQLPKSKSKKFIVKHLNALNMSVFEDGFIDKIVTDPPWGIYEDVGMSIEVFYELMMKEMHRVLKLNGVIVILTAKKEELERVLLKFRSRLNLLEKYDVLISGKKASIYKLLKKNE